jgi:hypothetical protein
MVTVEEIKSAIKLLPDNDYIRLRNWILEKDWEIWDQKIKEDSKEGKLDFLINEALQAKEKGNLTDL